jgi:NAD(P)-dependent dehydrogenase (short-subunit alcohol dehydrogenase family)
MSEERERIEGMIELLERLEAEPERAAAIDRETWVRLQRAAGRIARSEEGWRRAIRRGVKRRQRSENKSHDAQVLARADIRRLHRAPWVLPPPDEREGEREPHPTERAERSELRDAKKCYVCKAEFRRVHHFYDQLCPECAELNWQKRNATVDLGGRTAIVTGARVKIGYEASLKLLRAGARVLATTRFPRDAAARYAREHDFASFADRLEIHGLDLRHTPSVEAFARFVVERERRLDFVLNNACQTVRRPPAFYAHLLEHERTPLAELPSEARSTLATFEERRASKEALLPNGATFLPDSVELSQVALLPSDREHGDEAFPRGRLDSDLQQVDLRDSNSWRMLLADVPTVELLEVCLVNAVAPFVLNARLKELMIRERTFDKHIVNVSAMEGQFYRAHKTDRHPHTNMAKAALNMMTRTSATDYANDGIFMNSVDTGWITDEDPIEVAREKTAVHGFQPPLDAIDGAARICDPIFHGLATGEHYVGQFLKDYRPAPW